jgi:ribosomal protein S18 acetylase RimI-like enzyme
MGHELDNPAWNALGSLQRAFGTGASLARVYLPDVSPLAGLADLSADAFGQLRRIADGRLVSLLLRSASMPTPGWRIVASAPLCQMLLSTAPSPAQYGEALGEPDATAMMALAELTRPGPFAMRTWQLGSYIGTRDSGRLVAMAGERMRLPGYTEISAVCSHPQHSGRGHAARLISSLAHSAWERGEIPFLHVRQDNRRAIDLYERLGFQTRQTFSYAILEPEGSA